MSNHGLRILAMLGSTCLGLVLGCAPATPEAVVPSESVFSFFDGKVTTSVVMYGRQREEVKWHESLTVRNRGTRKTLCREIRSFHRRDGKEWVEEHADSDSSERIFHDLSLSVFEAAGIGDYRLDDGQFGGARSGSAFYTFPLFGEGERVGEEVRLPLNVPGGQISINGVNALSLFNGELVVRESSPTVRVITFEGKAISSTRLHNEDLEIDVFVGEFAAEFEQSIDGQGRIQELHGRIAIDVWVEAHYEDGYPMRSITYDIEGKRH